NAVIEKDRRAVEMGLGARLEFGNSGVRLYMQSPQPIAEGPLTLRLIHPTRAEQDQELVLVPFGDNYYEASGLESLAAVTWEVQVADNQGQWRMVKKQRLVDNPILEITP
ncbi:MAG: FixH family protein, partial [Gammaproteobacteria bacterium]|nr:FixH family protein [Gammaproteobacteria bacterium]